MKWLVSILNIFGNKKPSPLKEEEFKVIPLRPTQPAPEIVPQPPATEAAAPALTKKKVPTREQMALLVWQFVSGEVPTGIGPYKDVKETNGKNRSKAIDLINLTQGGYYGAPYCQTGMQEVLDEKCRYYGIGRSLVKIPEGAGTQRVWAETPSKYKSKSPVLCSWVSWNSGGGKGHTGEIVKILTEKEFKTMEFNTSAVGQRVERDGEGFYYGLIRDIDGYGGVKINGYIDVYQAIVDAMIESGKFEA